MPYAVQLIDKRATGEKLINFETATLESSGESSLEERQEVEMEQFEVLENKEEERVTDEDGEVADVEADVEFDVDTVPGLFVAFDNWLQSPDGGKKDVKTAKQHASQIKRILLVIDSDKKVSSLLDFSLLKEKFVKYAEEKYVAETIQSYLTSLQHFYTSLLSGKPKEVRASCELISQLRENEEIVYILQTFKLETKVGEDGRGGKRIELRPSLQKKLKPLKRAKFPEMLSSC